MKFKIDDDILEVLLFISFLVFMVIASISFVRWVFSDGEPMSPDGVIYIQDETTPFGISGDLNDNLIIGNYKNDIFKLVNHDYSFSDIEDYELYYQLSSPIVFCSSTSFANSEINYTELFDAAIDKKDYSDIGLNDSDVNGSIKIRIYGNDKEKDLIKNFLKSIYPDNYDELERRFTTDSYNAITIAFSYDMVMHDWKEIKSNLPNVEGQFDLYRKNTDEGLEYNIKNLPGFDIVEDFSGESILEYKE